MDTREENILEVLDENSEISQREIAQKTNLSLGLVNTLLKSCMKKGLIKIEKLNYRKVKYILTPKGINEKAKKTIKYIKKSYRTIITLSDKIKRNAPIHKVNDVKIILYGEKDEIYNIIKENLEQIEIEYMYIYDVCELEKIDGNYIVYIWTVDDEKLFEKGKYMNIIKEL